MNSAADPLQLHEAEAIRSDPKCQERVLRSYEMMLDFYGMKLVDRNTGTIARAEHYKKRYRNLNYSSHNYLRITRILKCLGELGFEHLKAPFVEFVIREILEHGKLRNAFSSCSNYWLETIRDETHRRRLRALIKNLQQRDAPLQEHKSDITPLRRSAEPQASTQATTEPAPLSEAPSPASPTDEGEPQKPPEAAPTDPTTLPHSDSHPEERSTAESTPTAPAIEASPVQDEGTQAQSQ